MNRLLSYVACAVAAVLLATNSAQAALPDLGVDPATITADVATGLGEWIGPMILLGFAVIVVVYGLKFFKRAQ